MVNHIIVTYPLKNLLILLSVINKFVYLQCSTQVKGLLVIIIAKDVEGSRWILNVFWKWNIQHDLWTMIQAGKIIYCNFPFCTVINLNCCSVTKLCPTLCNPMDCSIPGFPVHHQLMEFTQTHVYQIGDAIQPSSSVVPFTFCLQSCPASGSFHRHHRSAVFKLTMYW